MELTFAKHSSSHPHRIVRSCYLIIKTIALQSTAYESIYEPISPRPPSQMSTRSAGYGPVYGGSQYATAGTVIYGLYDSNS